jgi:hypothetical protein
VEEEENGEEESETDEDEEVAEQQPAAAAAAATGSAVHSGGDEAVAVVVAPSHVAPEESAHSKQPAQPRQDTATDKGKDKVDDEAGDEIFYEAASSLPWDERPFRQMYGQHRDEVNQIVSSLQQSLSRYLVCYIARGTRGTRHTRLT